MNDVISRLSDHDLYKAAAIAEGFEEVPVSIERFLNDPEYLGQIYGDGGVYPYWQEALKKIYPNPIYSPYEEICITGAIGIGKTTLSLIGALYDLYHVVLLKDPHKKYKLLPTTSIIFSLVTATMDLASAVMANQFLDALGASPWFCKHFNPRKGERLDEDMFPHHIGIGFGSRGGHNLGKAVIGAIIDEANFQDKVSNQAVDNYNTITRRMKSRFMLKGGSLPCRRWVISSRTDSAAFLESHIEAMRDNPKVCIFAPSIWEVQKYKGIYCGETFPVFTGTQSEQPKIITTAKELEACAGYIIQVPVEYKDEFEDDLPKSLQDLAGVATRNGTNLIYNVEKLDQALCLDNCVSTDELKLTLEGPDHIRDYYKTDLPKGHYYVHLDGALKGDRFGFAMSRVTGQIAVDHMSSINGETISRITPAVDSPICFGLKALPGSEVPLWKVRQFLCDLRDKHVSIAQISADGFNSADMLQMLKLLGFNVKYVSVDRTKDAYLKLASNISLGTSKMPNSPILRKELLNLQNLPNKIDHPMTITVNGKQEKGGKDIADAIAASQHEAILNALSLGAASLVQASQAAPILRTYQDRKDYITEKIFGLSNGLGR